MYQSSSSNWSNAESCKPPPCRSMVVNVGLFAGIGSKLKWFSAMGYLALVFQLAGCSGLSLYNKMVPSETNVDIAASDLAYGQAPRQRLDIYKPQSNPRAAPVIVFFYGGSWNSGRKEDYAFAGNAFAARGFVVVVADYRLVPKIRFPTFLEDCALAVAWVHTNIATFGGDPDRLFLLGHSAGAYNAAMLALDSRYLENVGLSTRAIRGVAALAGPFDFLPLDVDSTQAAFSNAPDANQTQPIHFVSKTAPPLFLATGDEDTTVKPRNSQQLAERLKLAGGKVVLKTYPGIGHVGILLAISTAFRSRAPVVDDVINFFEATR